MDLENSLDLITTQILRDGYEFSDQQKEVIFANESANIVAAPGSGKTTVLIAKYALLLKKGIDNHQGICLITHTNVAVDEIKLKLKELGIGTIEYPNFIGTIQDFANTYFARKAFHLIHDKSNFRVLDDEEYKLKFEKVFQRLKPNNYTYTPPNPKGKNPELTIFENLTHKVTSNAPPFYKDAFEKSIETLFSWGIVNNKQCLELALWYIEKHKEAIKNGIKKRFKYVFLDEAQDTNYLQYKMLRELFSDSEVIFQKFGDPLQALYNIFDGNNDVWNPNLELHEEGIRCIEIFETSRFGPTIVNVLRNVCIKKYENLNSLKVVQSFKPNFILYNNGEDLLEHYEGLIANKEKESEEFLNTMKKDAIVSFQHKDLTRLFKAYKKPSNKNIIHKSKTENAYNFLIGLISKNLDIPFNDIKERVNSDLDSKVKLSHCISELYSNSYSVGNVRDNLEKVLRNLTDDSKQIFPNENINTVINFYHEEISKHHYELLEDNNNFNERDISIGTIHSVKGETHRSTLLVLDTIFRNYTNDIEYSIFELLQDYLIGNYTNPQIIENEFKKNETIKSLKLAYVALSRPTHLMAIAIPNKFITEKNIQILKQLKNAEWEQYNGL